VFFAKSVNMSMDTYGKWMAFYFALSLLQAFPIGWLADKFHPIQVGLVALLLHGLASLWGGVFIHTANSFALGFVMTGVLSGTYFTATASLAAALLPKLKFAQYASAWGIVNCLGTMVIGPVMGRFLDYSHHKYRYTYLAGFGLDAAALLLMLVVFRKFNALGGSRHYVAPE
jgi:MFS family permease